MEYKTLITTQELHAHLGDANWALFDCRFDLTDPDAGEKLYLQAHIPGAVYVHLDHDLSTKPTGRNGRHPLPTVEVLEERFSQWGIDRDVQVVAYDARGGGFAVRLWWTLRYLGHDAVAVLDGGYPAWFEAGFPTESGDKSRDRREFKANPNTGWIADVSEVENIGAAKDKLLIDARAPERYRGEVEPLDPVAGHIPGALNRFWQMNLGEDGHFLPIPEIRSQLSALLGDTPPQNVIWYCGSGVTSCHNIFAMVHAGMGNARLYPGSWSEWCADPSRPIGLGEEP